MAATIKQIQAREILDSRGHPTLETLVVLSDDSYAFSSIPSGVSLGKHEALELRDQDPDRFNGLGVLKAVDNVNKKIFPILKSLRITKQEKIDQLMRDLDGTPNKSRLGANALLSVSQACLKAASASFKTPLYRYLKKEFGLVKKLKMPKPAFNLINAGEHGQSGLEFQEFHFIPAKQKTFKKNLQVGQLVYQSLKKILDKKRIQYSLGDEAGFSPDLLTNLDGFQLLKNALKAAKLKLGSNAYLGLDAAASTFFKDYKYRLSDFTSPLSSEKLIAFYLSLVKRFHFYYLEDPLNEEAWEEWSRLRRELSQLNVLVVGDDLLTTNPERLKKAIEKKACNAILIKPNQIGTMTETLEVIKMAREADFAVIISHRSGETNDDFLADLAVGVGAEMVKFGAPASGERVVKYNRLLQIEAEYDKNK